MFGDVLFLTHVDVTVVVIVVMVEVVAVTVLEAENMIVGVGNERMGIEQRMDWRWN